MASLSYSTSSLVPRPGNIGWVNFGSGFTLKPGTPSSNLQANFPDGSSVAFTISCTSVANGGNSFTAVIPSTSSSASFGNTGYANIPGSVCLYSATTSQFGTRTKITLSNINITDPDGNPIADYYAVFADADTTTAGEVLQFTSDIAKWDQFTLLPPVGGASSTGPTISYTNQGKTVTETGNSAQGGISGPVFITKNPTSISAIITENGTNKQGFAVGFTITSIILKKNIVGRVYPSDQFVLDINGTPGATATTSGNTSGIQQQIASVYLPIPPNTITGNTTSYSINEGLAEGSLSQPYYYSISTSVENKSQGGSPIVASTLPQEIVPQFGDEIIYTITNTPVYIEALKSVDIGYSDVNQTLTYTVTLTNPSTSTISNILVQDQQVNGVTYSGNLQVIGSPYTGDNPSTGITISTISPGQYIVMIWTAAISSTIPSTNPIKNIATVSVPGASQLFKTNTVITQVNTAILNTDKTVDNSSATIGDILTYTISTQNSGNVSATNVVMTDPLSIGTELVSGSVWSNSPYTGNDPSTGIILTNNITPSRGASLSYKVEVVSIPNPNPIPNTATFNYNYTINPATLNGGHGISTSNTVYTKVSSATLTGSKSVTKKYADIGDTLTYTLLFTNNGNVNADNVFIIDTIPNGTSFVSGSILSNITYTGTDPSTGLTLSQPIIPGNTLEMTYDVLVGNTIPNPNPIQNRATSNYTFKIDPQDQESLSRSITTNTVTTQINNAYLVGTSNGMKSVDRSSATVGDILTYTISATNVGNIAATNVVIVDTIPNGTSLVPGSVVVNVASSGSSPETGIILTDPINPGATVTMTFKVMIN